MTLSKNSLFLGIFFIFIFSTCSDNDCIEHKMEFTWSINKSIEIDPEIENVIVGDSMISIVEYQILEGQNMLFEFNELFKGIRI